ncbi:MAG: peptidoglycan DD-metalloendopeptidase family protein [Bacteroidales bacterium]
MKRSLFQIIIYTLLFISIFDSDCLQKKAGEKTKNPDNIIQTKLEYGIPVDSFIVEEKVIKAGTSLSTLMNGLDIAADQVTSIITKAAGVFDLTKIKQGNTYKVFHSKDSLKKVNYLVYEHSPTDYILFNFTDSIQIEKRQKEIVSKTLTASGVIESSLWEAITGSGASPMLALKLSDLYAWAIDFFGLQKGDQFKVYYEEQFVDGQSIGVQQIYSAWFKHMGKEYYAIPFVQDSTVEFFEENGNNLKKAFLKAPLSYSRIASRFSNSRLHPILKIRRPHHGVDYSAPKGTPVQSLGDGIVIHASYTGEAGNYIKIRHNSMYTTGYMHLSGYANGLRPGKHVSQGEVIGYVGSTGLATGPHLDFRVWKFDQPIDPLKLESPPVDPIKKEKMEFFTKIRDVWMKELAKVQVDTVKILVSK